MNPSGIDLRRTPEIALSPDQMAQLAVLRRQRRRTSFPYYSKVKFLATRAASGAGFAYTVALGTEVRPFSYAVGKSMESAGFTQTGDGRATLAETNLRTENLTISGEEVLVHGLAIQVQPSIFHLNNDQAVPHRIRFADYRLLAALWDNVSVEIALNGDSNRFPLGTLGMIPGAGGIMGGALDTTGLVAIAGEPRGAHFPVNGWPTRSNYFQLPEGLIWRKPGDEDGMLNFILTCRRAVTIFSGGSPENVRGDVAAEDDPTVVATTTEGYAYPTELPIGLMVHLIGEVVSKRTKVA